MTNLTTSPEQLPNSDEGNGEWMAISPKERFAMRVSPDDTNGLYSVLEFVIGHRSGTPMHIHDNEEERLVILEGTGHFARGDERMDLSAGDSLILARGVPHAFCNLSEKPLRLLAIFTPGRIGKGFIEIAKAKTAEDVVALATQYGTRVVGPPLFDDVYWKVPVGPSSTR
jgi:mannose-6-phosphate isomerase-like protein (cupin superfamily)